MRSEYAIYDKCKFKLGPRGCGSDTWSEDGAISHAVSGGYTLCGVRVGPEERGWFKVDRGYFPEASCKRCLKRLSAEDVQRIAEAK